jgi:large subunit ribosomal protein L30e
METITSLPKKKATIGFREISKAIKEGRVKSVIAAKNCPPELLNKLPKNVDVKIFDGNQDELGTKIGKPFAVAMVGYGE